MGTYLSKPVTEKVSSDGKNDSITYGCSAMQGWRIYQEDAHNSALDFDDSKCLFAIYDGHGGHDVATYAASNLPLFIKNSDKYKNGEYSEALVEAFLKFDETLINTDVQQVLKELAGSKDEDDSDYDGEEVTRLCQEATMPLEEVVAKYTEKVSEFPNSTKKSCEKSRADSPCYSKSDLQHMPNNNSLCLNSPGCSLSISDSAFPESSIENTADITGDEKTYSDTSLEVDLSVKLNDSTDHSHLNGTVKVGSNLNSLSISGSEKEQINCEVVYKDSAYNKTCSEENSTAESGVSSIKKTFVTKPQKEIIKSGKRILQKRRTIENILSQMQNSDSTSDEDSDECQEGEEGRTFYKDALAPLSGGTDDDSEYETDDEDDDIEDSEHSEDDNEEEEEKNYSEFAMNMREEPGYDSGCTACVVFINKSELVVANVGDSRCVVCRNGQAIDMSVDHKPEDTLESERIIKAGGKITFDGRVNGGLNLSRALGDHSYKQNKNLKAEEQMISPYPDIRTLQLTQADKFLILACDGIWNSMSSQVACDFVSARLKPGFKLSTICEEIFDHCLAPDVRDGDGTGCDNMTCIIISFSESLPSEEVRCKRLNCSDLPEEEEEKGPEEKKVKLEGAFD